MKRIRYLLFFCNCDLLKYKLIYLHYIELNYKFLEKTGISYFNKKNV